MNYNGLSKDVLSFDGDATEKSNTIVYVGNVKPHKGLATLIEAYKMLPSGKFRLKIIGEREGFLTGMKAEQLDHEGVIFTGRLSDEDLLREIASAAFLVQPSLYEGFGLPPLEALWLGTQPILSDIPVFREIYDGFPVVFFEAGNAQALKEALLAPVADRPSVREKILQKFSYVEFTNRLKKYIQGIGD